MFQFSQRLLSGTFLAPRNIYSVTLQLRTDTKVGPYKIFWTVLTQTGSARQLIVKVFHIELKKLSNGLGCCIIRHTQTWHILKLYLYTPRRHTQSAELYLQTVGQLCILAAGPVNTVATPSRNYEFKRLRSFIKCSFILLNNLKKFSSAWNPVIPFKIYTSSSIFPPPAVCWRGRSHE